jgi:hypothetical protein
MLHCQGIQVMGRWHSIYYDKFLKPQSNCFRLSVFILEIIISLMHLKDVKKYTSFIPKYTSDLVPSFLKAKA